MLCFSIGSCSYRRHDEELDELSSASLEAVESAVLTGHEKLPQVRF